ncbi:MAG: hypothetical protein AB7V01_03885 [Vicinamibacterales bacterium]
MAMLFGTPTGDARDGGAINAAYRRDVYHKPNDDMSQAFDFGAGAGHAKVNFLVGWQVAQETARPAWNPGDFFGGGGRERDRGDRDALRRCTTAEPLQTGLRWGSLT